LFHTVNHAVFKGLLFLGAGSVYKATDARDLEKFGGLIKRMPWTAAAFLVGSMAISALPPLNGFVSEWLTLQALFSGAISGTSGIKILMGIYASALALTGGLAAACFVKAFGVTFLAMPRSRKAEAASEVSFSMISATGFLAVCAILFGLCASPILKFLSRVAASSLGIESSSVSLTPFTLSLGPSNGTYLSSPLIALVLLVAGAGVFAGIRFFMAKNKTRLSRTWGCGYYHLDSRTEYTSTAFSKPFRIVFSFLLKPYRRMEKIQESHYHMKSMRYEVYTTPVIRQYLYGSTLNLIMRTAKIMRRMQTGSIHLYISYIFITIVLLILFL
jgi:hydrogenase-4 component B